MKQRSTAGCPECGSSRSSVVFTKDTEDGQRLRRRHCAHCEHRWYTLQAQEKLLPKWAITFNGKGTKQQIFLHPQAINA